ncbi:MAG: RNase III inhibitor, partial [Clostridiales bacterium]|nr:RNase III inhibitor [Clostridiales bacterium]
KENKCTSIAFPLISSGIYGYPKAEAFGIAAAAIADFLAENEMDIYLAVFDKAALSVSETLMGEVKRFVDENYVMERERYFSRNMAQIFEERAMDLEACMPAVQPVKAAGSAKKAAAAKTNKSLESMICDLDESFSETLLRLIDKTGESDAAVYKRANIDRRHFSKIRNNPGYMPTKSTVLAFAVALKLSLAETKDLLSRAGYALSRSRKMDVIVEFFIRSGNYDIQTINQVLFQYDQPLLGG